MKIIDIYEKYHLPENLQMHMLRVASCANLILDNWTGSNINREAVIRVSLLHDMGNLVKIPEDFSDDEGFRVTRKKYFEKYGTNDHEINLEIGRIEGLTDFEIEILDGKRSRKNEETLNCNSYERKICAYCDQRVAPTGVVSLKERLEDAKVRYKNKPLSAWSSEEKAKYLTTCALGIEKQIMDNCSIKPEDINDENISRYVDALKNYEIVKKIIIRKV